MRIVALALSAALLCGCSGTIPVQYIPQTMLKAHGKTQIGEFTYQPFLNGWVKANQIQNTAAGSVYIATDVAKLVQRGTASELEKAGIEIGPNSAVTLTGLFQAEKSHSG